MKIFLSYGHDHNAPLVERIRNDLEAGGHTVWIDKKEIRPGDDWRRRITDGLSDTNWTLGFLSKHSTRNPGVCLDELAIALNARGGAVATVLVEAEGEVDVPVSVSHIQWLDMHDWSAREQQGGAAWEEWYRGKVAEILRLLDHPATKRFAGECEELERRLTPISYVADIGALVDGFVGREWLRQQLDEWRKTARDSRLFWLTGGPGTGKSAFSAWLAHRGGVNVIGINLCRYNSSDRRNPSLVLRTLAFQIATRLPDYRKFLLDRLRIQDPNGIEVARKNANDLFDWLLVDPLRHAIDGGRSADRYLVIIDALDETIVGGRSELAKVLAGSAQKLPSWMAMMVTSRPEAALVRQFGMLKPQEIKADAEQNLHDVREYARKWLDPDERATPETEALINRVVTASGGNFLYLRMLREAVTNERLDLAAPEGLPQGLVGLYEQWFDQRFPEESYEDYRPILDLLVAATHPVPEAWLFRLLGSSEFKTVPLLEKLGSLFPNGPEGIAPFHKSLRDWLTNRQAGPFWLDPDAGPQRLREGLWSAFVAQKTAEETLADKFLVAELPAQMTGLKGDVLRTHLASAGAWADLHRRLEDVAISLSARYAWDPAIAWWQLSGTFAEQAGDTKALSDAHNRIGDILVDRGDFAGSLAQRETARAIAAQQAQAEPGNLKAQRQLSFALSRLGETLRTQGKLAEAAEAYHASLAIDRRLSEADPGNTEWQRDLSLSCNNVGDILVDAGRLTDAQHVFVESLAIRERLLKLAPDNFERQRDLAAAYNNVSDVLRRQNSLDGALETAQLSAAITQRLVETFPKRPEAHHARSVSCNRLGNIHSARGERGAALHAFKGGLSAREHLALLDPGNVNWQLELAGANSNLAGMGDDPARRWLAVVAILRKLKDEGKLPDRGAGLLARAEANVAKL